MAYLLLCWESLYSQHLTQWFAIPPCPHEFWWGSPLGPVDTVGQHSWNTQLMAHCHQLAKQWVAVGQTKQKGNKSVLGKAQASSRSCFKLLLLLHSLLHALSPSITVLVRKETWAKCWHKMVFYHPWVTVTKQGVLCLTQAGLWVRTPCNSHFSKHCAQT